MKFLFVFKKTPKVFIQSRIKQIFNPTEFFWSEVRNFLLHLKKFMELSILPKNRFSSECVSGHVEGSFDNRVEKKSSKNTEKFTRKPKTVTKNLIFMINLFFFRMFLRHFECSFNYQETFAQIPKNFPTKFKKKL